MKIDLKYVQYNKMFQSERAISMIMYMYLFCKKKDSGAFTYSFIKGKSGLIVNFYKNY